MEFVWSHWRRLPWRFGAMLAGTTLATLIEIQIPRFSSELVVATERHLGEGAGLAEARNAGLALLFVFAGLSLVRQLYLRNWMYFTSQVMQRIVADGFRQVQRFSLDWHTSHFAGSTQRKITRGMWAYDSLADTLMIELGPALALLLGFSVAMYMRDPGLGLYFAGAVAVFVVVSSALSLVYVAPANQFANEADTEVGGALADSIACVSIVKSFGAEGREENRFEDTSQRWRFLSRRSWLRSMDAGAVQSVMLVILLAGLLGLVLLSGGTGEERVADAVYVVATYLVVHGYLRNIGWQVRNAQRAVNEVEGLVAISLAEPGVRDIPGAKNFRSGPGGIRFEAVEFRYRNQPRPIFRALSLEIAPGEKVALVGESGSAKALSPNFSSAPMAWTRAAL
jgi:ATP-binding cassette subfamily B protein